jgi:hypothetical protein
MLNATFTFHRAPCEYWRDMDIDTLSVPKTIDANGRTDLDITDDGFNVANMKWLTSKDII